MAAADRDITQDMKKAMAAADFTRAAAMGVRLLRSHPRRTDIELMTAVCELRGGQGVRAGQRLRRLFRATPPHDRFFSAIAQNLIQFADATGDFDGPAETMEQMAGAHRDMPVYRDLLADMLMRQENRLSPGRCVSGNVTRIITLLESLPGDYPRLFDARRALAGVYLQADQPERAFALLDQLLATQRGNMSLRAQQASAYAMAGMVEQAIAANLALIADFGDARVVGTQPYMSVAFLRPQALPENTTDVLAPIANDRAQPADQRYRAAFTLARLHESRDDMKAAFDYYALGHAANRAAHPFDIAAELAEFDEIIALSRQLPPVPLESGAGDKARNLARDLAGNSANGGAATPRPVFILGMPRSGTTLSERILDAHPDAFGAGEITDLARIITETLGAGKISEQMRRLNGKTASVIRKRYMDAMALYAPDARVVVNKTPANFLRLGIIRHVFPDAAILHTHRHALATCLSIYTTPFAMPMRYADDLGDLAAYYRGYQNLVAAFFEMDEHGQMFDLPYEGLVADPEGMGQRFLAHCGLDWRDECLDFHRNEKAARTASMVQVQRPVNQDGLGKWRRFEPYIGPLAGLMQGETTAG